MTHDQAQRPRDYGGWRRRRSIGLWGLGTGGTFTVLAALMALILVAAADIKALVYVAPPVLAIGAISLARINGEPIAVRAVRRVRWWHATSRKYNRYRAAVIREHSAGFQLPGVLAPTALVDAEDGYGGRYGVGRPRPGWRTGPTPTPGSRTGAAGCPPSATSRCCGGSP